MKLSKSKLELTMAEKCMNPFDVCRSAGIPYQTFRRAAGECHIKPATLGRVAKALDVNPAQIIKSEA